MPSRNPTLQGKDRITPLSENRSDLIEVVSHVGTLQISNDPWSFMPLVNCLGMKPYFAGVKTIRLVYSSMKIPATRTAVRAHSGNRWVGFLEGIDAQKLSRSTHCKEKKSKIQTKRLRSMFLKLTTLIVTCSIVHNFTNTVTEIK